LTPNKKSWQAYNQGCGAGAPELGIFPGAGAGAQILKIRSRSLVQNLGRDLEAQPFER